jgi:hypothetical protein
MVYFVSVGCVGLGCAHSSWLDAPLRDIATLFHYCQNDKPGPANEAYVSLQTTDPSLVGLDQVMAQYASGAMCGTSPFGLFSEYSLGLEALAVTCSNAHIQMSLG